MDLYWFMPALANSRVGSECGTTDDEGTFEDISTELQRSACWYRYTKFMSIFLEVLYERSSNFSRWPLLLRSHIGRDCGVRPETSKVGVKVSRTEYRRASPMVVTQIKPVTPYHSDSSHQAAAEEAA